MHSGLVLTNHVFGDMSLRFSFRLSDAASEGRVIVHTLIRAADNFRPVDIGYAVALTSESQGVRALGRVSSLGSRMAERVFEPIATKGIATDFHTCEVRTEYMTLRVFIDGQLVSEVTDRNQFGGYVGFEANKGRGIEIRDAQIARLPSYREPFAEGVARLDQNGITLPRVLDRPSPFYAVEPMRRRITGVVSLEVVLDPAGKVGDVRVLKSLDTDLDESAIATVRRWRFSAATLNGVPVPVLISVDMSFSLTK